VFWWIAQISLLTVRKGLIKTGEDEMVLQFKSDAGELAEFRKNFWITVENKVKELGIPLNKFLKDLELTNTEFIILKKGEKDFEFSRIYRIRKVLNCSFNDLFSGL
jgi:hypothetical protein